MFLSISFALYLPCWAVSILCPSTSLFFVAICFSTFFLSFFLSVLSFLFPISLCHSYHLYLCLSALCFSCLLSPRLFAFSLYLNFFLSQGLYFLCLCIRCLSQPLNFTTVFTLSLSLCHYLSLCSLSLFPLTSFCSPFLTIY